MTKDNRDSKAGQHLQAVPRGLPGDDRPRRRTPRRASTRSSSSSCSTRASQINHCAWCLDMHTQDARKVGISEQKLYLLNAWEEVPGACTPSASAPPLPSPRRSPC